MQKSILAGIALAVALTLIGCGGSKYDDAIEVNQEYVDAMEAYLDGIEQAQSGSDLAGAINKFADKMESLAPRMKAVAEKYPEWKDQAKVPEELKPLTEKAEGLAQRMAGSFMKAMQYIQDPEVQAAQKRLMQSMSMMK